MLLHVPAPEPAWFATVPPGALEGLTLVVDADAGPPVMAAIRASGAAAGLLLTTFETPPTEALETASVALLPDPGSDDAGTFRIRTLATRLRAAAPNLRLLLVAPDIPERLEAYVDGRVAQGPTLAAPAIETLVSVSLEPAAVPRLVRLEAATAGILAALAGRRAFSSEVLAAAPLTVDDIVARHQAQQRRQELLVRRTIARGSMSLLFEVPGFVAPVTVTADTVIYRSEDRTDMELDAIRVNGAAIVGGSATSPPQLPLIEAERIATPPLTITLDETYRYGLAGRSGDSYVVTFEPQAPPDGRAIAGPLAAGRAWIDATTFALRRLDTIQTGLRGAIVSSEQRDDFGPFPIGGEIVWLPVRTSVYQMYEGAGHRTPIHRAIETPSYDINPPDFETRRQTAYGSPRLMLRETPQGFQYLLRDPAAGDEATRAVAPRAGERIRTAVFGLVVDPNITVPLPFAGFSYVDLNLLDTGAQLNAFFGGSYGQASWSVPSLGRTRWQLHGRVFAIAASYNDRAFRGGVEQYAENITQRPAHVSTGLIRPLTPRLRARVDYELDYTAFDRSDTTAAAFVVPTDALVHGMTAALEGEWGPWSARAWWNPAIRQHWTQWGPPADADQALPSDARGFQRFGIVAARTLALGRIVGSRVEMSWMDGRDLDRFSRYTFGAFDNRLRGYPTASIRYDRGAVLRTVTSWSARGWRVDAFGDMAVVRDPGFGDAFRGYPGAGLAVEAGGPFRTLWSVEWGYGFKGRAASGRSGTQAMRVTGYRTF